MAPVSSTESTNANNTREDEAQESELADLICELAVMKARCLHQEASIGA